MEESKKKRHLLFRHRSIKKLGESNFEGVKKKYLYLKRKGFKKHNKKWQFLNQTNGNRIKKNFARKSVEQQATKRFIQPDQKKEKTKRKEF